MDELIHASFMLALMTAFGFIQMCRELEAGPVIESRLRRVMREAIQANLQRVLAEHEVLYRVQSRDIRPRARTSRTLSRGDNVDDDTRRQG